MSNFGIAPVRHLMIQGIIEKSELLDYYEAIESKLIRFPSIEPTQFRNAVEEACAENDEDTA
jgi:hypothetical protein